MATWPSLVKQARRALLQGGPYWAAPGGRQLAHIPYMLKLRPEWTYRRRSLYCFSLRTEDYAIIRLPDRLFPLYFLLGPFVWGFRQLQQRRQRTGP